MPSVGNPNKISIGPGVLYVAPLLTAEPTSASAALPPEWVRPGYTENGTEIVFDRNWEDIEVAEELEPVDTVENRLSTMLRAQLAQVTRSNLLLGLQGLAAEPNNGTAVEAPTPGDEEAFMLIWDKHLGAGTDNVRWLFRRVKSKGSITVALRKSPNKALIPVEFQALVPENARSWRCFPDADGRVF